ncbi:MAG: hypothetical protein Hens3KO_23620 [Henriciella sp.]
MPLTDLKVRNLKPREKSYKVADGNSLYVLVKPNGSKLWQMAYRFDGRQKTLSFGPYPTVTLSMARHKSEDARALKYKDIDPATVVREEKQIKSENAKHTFNHIADELLRKRELEGLAETTLKKKCWLLSLARPVLGKRPIRRISAPDILQVLRKVEAKGNYESAKRLRTTIGEVFR